MNRRDFVKYISSTGLLMGIPFSDARIWAALSKEGLGLDRFFVSLILDGGWDTTLCTDPWTHVQRPDEKDLFLEYRAEELISVGNLTMGPSMADLKPFAGDFSIVNGLFMSAHDNGHFAPLSYLMTGESIGSKPDLPVEVSHSIESGPYGVVVNRPASTKNRNVAVSSFEDIKGLLTTEDPGQTMFNLTSVLGGGKTELIRAQAKEAQSSILNQKLIQELKALSGEVDKVNPGEVLRALFLTGAASTAQIFLGEPGFLDTHSNHVDSHKGFLKARFEQIAKIFSIFKSTEIKPGVSLFDRTTFMIFSEFSRTAALNASKGKDHNPLTNSVILAGRGIKGGQVIGASKLIDRKQTARTISYQVARPFDFQTGLPVDRVENVDFIFPENIVRTVAEAIGVNWNTFDSVSKETNFIRNLTS